jgi:hypothetical protein
MATLTIYHGAAKPIRAVGRNQCRLLAFAEKYPGWHTLATDRATVRAVTALQKRGCLEVIGDQFRFCYPNS